MQEEAKRLIKVLEGERTRRKMDHRAFSTLLGIHESYWHRIRTGQRPINLNLLTILRQKLPEVTPEVTIFFMSQGDDGKNKKHPSENGGGKPLGLLGTRKGSKQPQLT